MSFNEFATIIQTQLVDPVTGAPLYTRPRTNGILSAALRGKPNAETAARRIGQSFSRRGYNVSSGNQMVVDFVEAGLAGHYGADDIFYTSYLLRTEPMHLDF